MGKSFDAGEGSGLEEERVLYMTAVKQQQLETSQGRPGPPVAGAASKTPATSTAISATFDIFERMEACEREGTLRHADRSANDDIEFGMDSTPEICVERVRILQRELKLNLLVGAIKHGMDEGFHELAVQADEFQGIYQDGAPMPGTGDVVQEPKSRSLRKLLESEGMSSLAERALGRKAAAPAPSAGGEKPKAAQPSGAAKAKAKKSKNTSGVVLSPRHGRAGRRGSAIPAAATDASTTTSTASPTQPVLPHPPPHQVSLDSSSRPSRKSSKRSSNLNSSPSSSSSRRRPRGAGFSSQALPTSAGWLAAVGKAGADVEAPTRGAAAPGDAVSDSQGSANWKSRQKGGESQNERVPCSQTQGGPWDLAVHPSLGQFRRPCSTARKRG